jgi:hypothetical protein
MINEYMTLERAHPMCVLYVKMHAICRETIHYLLLSLKSRPSYII